MAEHPPSHQLSPADSLLWRIEQDPVLRSPILVVGLLPWFFTWLYVLRSRAVDERREIERPARAGFSELALAERLAAEEEPDPKAVTRAANRAISYFRRSLGEAGGDVPDALCGLGRAYELLGQETRAHEAWERAGSRPEARLGLARGKDYVRVDASPDSEPILRRLGLHRVATTTPYVLRT